MIIFGTRWTKKEILIMLLFAVGTLVWLVYSYYNNPFNVFLSYVAVLVAAVAALAASLSLKHARDTIRPFLSFGGTINIGGSLEAIDLAFPIKNVGSMPADSIEVIIHAFGTDEEIKIDNVSKKYNGFFNEKSKATNEEALVLFPDQTWQSVLIADMREENNEQLLKSLLDGDVKIRITIHYCSLGRKHKSVQTLAFDQLSLSSDKRYLHGISIKPQVWVLEAPL